MTGLDPARGGLAHSFDERRLLWSSTAVIMRAAVRKRIVGKLVGDRALGRSAASRCGAR
jgi:hypothetical protein